MVFSPDDLELIKGPPAIRRRCLMTRLLSRTRISCGPNRFGPHFAARNNLLKQAKGRLSNDLETSLTIWNEQLVNAAELIGDTQEEFIHQVLVPQLQTFCSQVAGRNDPVTLNIEADWRHTGLAEALVRSQDDEVRRGMTLVGPHRDDLLALLNSLPSTRSHASQESKGAWP